MNETRTGRRSVALLALTLASIAHAEPLHVPSQYPTIQSAIDAAEPGDEIHIAPGTYRELLSPENKSLTLIGAGPDQTILSGDLDGDTFPDGIILDYRNHLADVLPFITLRSLTMTDARLALRFIRAADIEIDSCDLTRCATTGIQQLVPQSGTAICRDITLTHCNFSGPGSDVRIYNANSVRVLDSTFANMTQGSLNTRSNTVEMTRTSFNGQASDASIDTQSGHITDCVFQNNHRVNQHSPTASALSIDASGPFTIENCRFVANITNDHIPAVYARGMADAISILGCEFADNRGPFESALSAGGIFVIDNCTFIRNVAEGVGPINLDSSRTTPSHIKNCAFINNGEVRPDGSYRPGGGGGFCIESGRAVVSDCLFQGNIASTAGAIMLGSQSNGVVVERSAFHANRSGNDSYSAAGAIYAGMLSRGRSRPLQVSNSIFIGNNAGSRVGGAIVATDADSISNSVFIGNISKDGSVVFREGSRTPNASGVAPILSGCIVVADPSDAPFASRLGRYSESESQNLITSNHHSPRFTRPPSHGGDGFGDDPRTPHIDESLNDDFGDLTLLPGSPAIDAGGNAKLPRDTLDLDRDGDTLELLVGTLDLAGNPRFLDDPASPNPHDPAGLPGPIDLGPYEFVPPPLRPYLRQTRLVQRP